MPNGGGDRRNPKGSEDGIVIPGLIWTGAEWLYKVLFAGILALGLREANRIQGSIERLEQSHSMLMEKMGELLTKMASQDTLNQAQGKQLDDHADRLLYLEHQRTREQAQKR